MRHLLIISVTFFGLSARSQHKRCSDSLHCVKDFFKSGEFGGHVRSFSMSTINQGPLTDYWTSAIGASLHYETARFRGFSIKLDGMFAFKVAGNDINKVDQLSNKQSRFERQLYDIEHPDNFSDLDRMEELFLRYRNKRLEFRLGRMIVDGPIVHAHDGRMKPKVFEGAEIKYHKDSLQVIGNYIWKASPRSTTHWYSFSEAIGIYNNGCLPDGALADYHHHIQSKGMGIFGIRNNIGSNTQWSVWNYFLENVSNTSLVQLNYKDNWILGISYLTQWQVGNGGNRDATLSYFGDENYTHVFSARIGHEINSHTNVSINATYALASGAYLFPREFGFDPFYTNLTRGWFEGLGNATTIALKGFWKQNDWEIKVGSAATWMEDQTLGFALNKYGMVSHAQWNLDLKYSLHGFLDGAHLRVLYVGTRAFTNQLSSDKIMNQLNYHHLNMIVNINF